MTWAAAVLALGLQAETEDLRFLRRVSLDLLGRIPLADEVRAFEADRRPDRRRRLVDDLLGRRERAAFWAGRLADRWIGPLPAVEPAERNRRFRAWLEERLHAPTARLGPIVRELLTASDPDAPEAAFLAQFGRRFDTLAGRTAWAFLGLRLQCAQCHDHPEEPWTQEDFWGVAAFFSRTDGRLRDRPEPLDTALEKRPARLAPRWLDGSTPASERWRAELADRIAADPRFAASLADRVREGLGAGPARAGGDDLRALLRSAALSSAYGTAPMRPLLPEQLFDSVAAATGLPEAAEAMSDDVILSLLGGRNATGEVRKLPVFRRLFVALAPGSLPHLLHVVHREYPLFAGVRRRVEGLLAEPDDGRIVEELYLSALSRRPTAAERAHWVAYTGRRDSRAGAFEDLFWGLLNADEFVFNH